MMQALFVILLIISILGFAAFMILLDNHFSAARNESISGFRRRPSKWMFICLAGNVALNVVLILVLTAIWNTPEVLENMMVML